MRSGIATIHGVAAGSATVTIRDSVNSRTVAVTVTPSPDRFADFGERPGGR